jgi:membrane-associated phospholipid phosphatase
MTSSINPAAQASNPGRLAAQWLSRIFHPFTIAPVVYWLVMFLSDVPALESLQWTALSFVVVIAPLVAALIYNVRRGRYSDMDVSIREHRYGLYALAILCFLILIALLNLLDAPRIALGCLYAASCAILAGALINRFLTKISLHSVTMAGGAAILFFVAPGAGIALTLATLLVGWARIYLNQHTPGQVLLGWLTAALCVAAILPNYTG